MSRRSSNGALRARRLRSAALPLRRESFRLTRGAKRTRRQLARRLPQRAALPGAHKRIARTGS
jgi:hypothetical protein